MLKAGFARVDITPPRDVSLCGYEFRQERLAAGNDGVLDPLFARALVLDDGTRPAALVALDVAIVPTALARRMRRAAAEAIGSAPDRVIIACTHTHSGPILEPSAAAPRGAKKTPGVFSPKGPKGAAQKRLRESFSPSPETRYTAALLEQVREAAARAGGLVYPVRPALREAPLGIGYVRRVPTPDGLRHCWNPQEQADLQVHPSPDPTCTVLVLDQQGGPRRYVLWGVGAHGVVLGKTSRLVSADWAGRACAVVEEGLPGARAMFLHGASGDVHPWIATQEEPAGVEIVGRAAGAMVALLVQATRPGPDELRTAARTVRIGKAELDLAAWRLGGVWIAAAPVELFSELGLALRRRLGGPVILATTANGWTGYWPTAEAFVQGKYEVENARRLGRRPEDGLRLVEKVAALAETIR